jgi:hypothetical protein
VFSRPSAGYRIVGSRAKINVNIVDVAHDVLVIPERRHDLVFAATKILPAADQIRSPFRLDKVRDSSKTPQTMFRHLMIPVLGWRGNRSHW